MFSNSLKGGEKEFWKPKTGAFHSGTGAMVQPLSTVIGWPTSHEISIPATPTRQPTHTPTHLSTRTPTHQPTETPTVKPTTTPTTPQPTVKATGASDWDW